MALESGKKLGYTASFIEVIMPVIAIVVVIAMVLVMISAFPVTAAAFDLSAFFSQFVWLFIAAGIIGTIGFVGYILFVVAMRRLAAYYNEPIIYRNTLRWLILLIIGVGVSLAVEFTYLLALLTDLSNVTISSTFPSQFLFSYLIVIAVSLIALVFQIVGGILYMRAFNKLADKSGVCSFRTAGILYLIGMVVPLLAWIAWIFAMIAFNRLKPRAPATSYVNPQASSMPIKYCTSCGAQNGADALYCGSCGKPQ